MAEFALGWTMSHRGDEEKRVEAGGRVSIMPGELCGLDPKPGELPMGRLNPR